MTTLALSIRRPPYDGTEVESHARRELLPHIRHVRECQAVTRKRLDEDVARGRPVWPVKESYGRLQAGKEVRFSRVYAESGQFSDTREL